MQRTIVHTGGGATIDVDPDAPYTSFLGLSDIFGHGTVFSVSDAEAIYRTLKPYFEEDE